MTFPEPTQEPTADQVFELARRLFDTRNLNEEEVQKLKRRAESTQRGEELTENYWPVFLAVLEQLGVLAGEARSTTGPATIQIGGLSSTQLTDLVELMLASADETQRDKAVVMLRQQQRAWADKFFNSLLIEYNLWFIRLTQANYSWLDANHVAQDALICISKGISTYDSRIASFKTWAYEIWRNSVVRTINEREKQRHIGQHRVVSFPWGTPGPEDSTGCRGDADLPDHRDFGPQEGVIFNDELAGFVEWMNRKFEPSQCLIGTFCSEVDLWQCAMKIGCLDRWKAATETMDAAWDMMIALPLGEKYEFLASVLGQNRETIRGTYNRIRKKMKEEIARRVRRDN